MHDYYVNSLGSYYRFGNFCIRCVIICGSSGRTAIMKQSKGSNGDLMSAQVNYKQSNRGRQPSESDWESYHHSVWGPISRPTIKLYHSLGIFSRRQVDDMFLIFPRKQDLTFHANCLLRRQFAWNVKSCFLGKLRKIFSKYRLLKILPRVLGVKEVSKVINSNKMNNHACTLPQNIFKTIFFVTSNSLFYLFRKRKKKKKKKKKNSITNNPSKRPSHHKFQVPIDDKQKLFQTNVIFATTPTKPPKLFCEVHDTGTLVLEVEWDTILFHSTINFLFLNKQCRLWSDAAFWSGSALFANVPVQVLQIPSFTRHT